MEHQGKLYSDFFGNITTHPERTGLKRLLPDFGIVAKCQQKDCEANAAELVKRWNSQPELLKACERLVKMLESEDGYQSEDLCPEYQQAKSAIALGRGE